MVSERHDPGPSGPAGEAGRPILFLDVDGVLNPFRANRPNKHWPDYRKHTVRVPDGRSYRMWFSPELGQRLTGLAAHLDVKVVWATSWAPWVESHVVPLAHLPSGLAVLPYPDSARDDRSDTGKLAEVAAYAGRRPAIWVDDDIGPNDRAWAEGRSAPTLVLRPLPTVGLRSVDLDAIAIFVTGLRHPG